MHCVFQRFLHSTVRFEENDLLVDSSYCGTDGERCARMIVAPDSFQVRRARWEVYRDRKTKIPSSVEIDELNGLVAYFKCGSQLRGVLSAHGIPEAAELFAEGVRAVIQAETFLVESRGYAGVQAYEEYWLDIYEGVCRYYSNLDRVSKTWYEHVGCETRQGSLFNRFKSQTLSRDQSNYKLSCHFYDSFHGVALELDLSSDQGLIVSASGDITRAPDAVCQESSAYLKQLIGLPLAKTDKKEIAAALGAENGCIHLIDLVSDGAKTFNLYHES